MAIKTDAMIAHNGADGYTLHIDYDPDSDAYDLKATFNDGTVKDSTGTIGAPSVADTIIDKSITYLETSVTVFGSYALRGCSRLVTVVAPNATSIQTTCFYGCSALKNVYIPNMIDIGSTAFQIAGLEEIYLPESVTSIAANAFLNCSQLTVINCGFSSTDPAAANAPWGAQNATVNYDVPAPNPPVISTLGMAPDPDLIQNIDLEPIEEIQPVEPEPVEVKKTTKRSAK